MVVVSQLRNPHAFSGLLWDAVNAVRKGTGETHKALWRSVLQTPQNPKNRDES